VTARYDIVIVGAGMAGASLAAHLAAKARVVLIEAEDHPGYHSTGRSAAFWTESYGGAGIQPLTAASGQELREGGFLTPRSALTIGRRGQEALVERFAGAFSALGVEEQRVNTIVQFTEPADARRALGHGYRVEARIIIWEADNVLKLPASALFRHGSDWAVFREEGGKARLTPVTIGRNNGIDAEVLEGLQAGDTIVLYPGSSLGDGVRIRQRAAG